MEIVSIHKANESLFFDLPNALYKDDKRFIAPLKQDLEKVFDPARNPYFNHGKCERWILMDNGKCIGRIAAFINLDHCYDEPQPTGGCGFFECIENDSAANLLFDTAKIWLQENGMEAMDGPVNFGERNAWWGLLVDGFSEPTYQMNYNPPFYKRLFEQYGFRNYFEQYSYNLPVNVERPQRFHDFYKKLLDRGYRFEHLQKNNLPKYAADFRTIYNKAWSIHPHFKPMSAEQADVLMKNMKPVILDYLVWFGYYNDEPVAMFVMLPELNQYFKHVNGKMNWLGKLKFTYQWYLGKQDKIFGIVFGVVPEHQRKGVEVAIVIAANEVVVPKKKWNEIELTWIGDFNPKMVKMCEGLGANVAKTHITYRKLFDDTKPFSRHPVI